MQNTDAVFLERWAGVYNLLLTIPPDQRFRMNTWGAHNRQSLCRTSACAAGHAALHPWFSRQGLIAEFPQPNYMDVPNKESFFGMTEWDDSPFNPEYCMAALGFDDECGCYDENGDEIDTDQYLTPDTVAEVVMKYMEFYWDHVAIAAAVTATTGVSYDIDYIHKHTPWNKEFVGDEVAIANT